MGFDEMTEQAGQIIVFLSPFIAAIVVGSIVATIGEILDK